MKFIRQNFTILQYTPIDIIELAGRTCYKSEKRIIKDDKGNSTTAPNFIRSLIKRKHFAMLEHGSATVRFVTNRGVTHELVRHRLCAFAQESTRYVKYDGEMEFILPVSHLKKSDLDDDTSLSLYTHMEENRRFKEGLQTVENVYKDLLRQGWQPQSAREILPNALKTEIVVTANYREWRHILELRALGTTGKPHPQMQSLMIPLLIAFNWILTPVFEDLYSQLDVLNCDPGNLAVQIQE